MQKHTKLYLDSMTDGHSSDYVPCEICEAPTNDIHHIKCRGMGGTKQPEHIRNLMALCRKCHDKYGDRKQYMTFLRNIHDNRMREHGLIL